MAPSLRPSEESTPIDQRFQCLVVQWHAEITRDPAQNRFKHPAYQEIIRLGVPVVSCLLRTLERDLEVRRRWYAGVVMLFMDRLRPGPCDWFRALRTITNTNPVPPQSGSNIHQIGDAWVRWGREHGFLRGTILERLEDYSHRFWDLDIGSLNTAGWSLVLTAVALSSGIVAFGIAALLSLFPGSSKWDALVKEVFLPCAAVVGAAVFYAGRRALRGAGISIYCLRAKQVKHGPGAARFPWRIGVLLSAGVALMASGISWILHWNLVVFLMSLPAFAAVWLGIAVAWLIAGYLVARQQHANSTPACHNECDEKESDSTPR